MDSINLDNPIAVRNRYKVQGAEGVILSVQVR
jgi:hypothetical protein